MDEKKVKVDCFTVNGHRSDCEVSLKNFVANLLPNNDPPVSTVIIESTLNDKPVFISINARGISVKDYKI